MLHPDPFPHEVRRSGLGAAVLQLALLVALPVGAVAARSTDLGHGARATLTRGGLTVSQQAHTGGTWMWGLTLRAYGHGSRARNVRAADMPIEGERTEYRHGPLTEWYANTGNRIEQGFTLRERPRGDGPLVLEFDLHTDLAPALSADRHAVTFTTAAGAILHYADLAAYDAKRTPLPASLGLASNRLFIQVDDRAATYPLTIDPLIYIEAKQVAFDAATSDHFGSSVSVDVDTAVVGAPDADDPTADAGAAYVFTRTRGAWTLQQKLTASDMAGGDNFGFSVAISGDTIVVGAPNHDDPVAGANAGAAYVFRRVDGVWTEREKLVAADAAAQDTFGWSVAVARDTVLIGSRAGDSAVPGSGSAYVFVFAPLATVAPFWPLQAELDAADAAADDFFGAAVSLDGDTALIGAYGRDDNGSQSGAAYVFTRSGTTWSQQQKLHASDPTVGLQFGWSVAVSGNTVAIGGPFDDDQNTDAGSVYVSTRTGTVWTEQDEIYSGSARANDHFGYSVAISSDAILVGVPDDSTSQGAAVLFTRSGLLWPQFTRMRASDRSLNDRFGQAVAISGGSLAVGAPMDDDLIVDQGAAYLYYAYDQNVDLQVGMAVDNPEPDVGDDIVFTVTVTNWGADDAAVVAIADPFPADLVFVSSLASRGTYDVNTGLWEIGTVPRYSSVGLTITAQAPLVSGGKTITNTASLRALDNVPDNDSASVEVAVVPPSVLQFAAAPAPIREGQTGSITIDRVGSPAGSVSVDFEITGGTATLDSDYTLASGTIVFADGETSHAIVLTALPDQTLELFETVTVALSNPAGGAGLGTPTTLTVDIADANDGDGDGFPDAVEVAAGTNPDDASSTPFGGQPAGPAVPLTMTAGRITLNFATGGGSDTLSYGGAILTTLPTVPAGQFIVDVGSVVGANGVIQAFTVDGTGRSTPKGLHVSPPRKGAMKFKVALKGGTFAALLAGAGLTNADVVKAPLPLDFSVYYQTQHLAAAKTAVYSAKVGRKGTAVVPRSKP